MAPQEIRLHEDILINPDFGSRSKGADRTGLGEPNMGNPSVRFDEGRSGSAGLTTAVSSIRLLPLRLLYQKRRFDRGFPYKPVVRLDIWKLPASQASMLRISLLVLALWGGKSKVAAW